MSEEIVSLRIKSCLKNVAKVESLMDDIRTQFSIEEEQYGKLLLASVEAVTNAIKHGNASWIKISSLQTADHWVLEIVNDGNGFDHTAVNHSGEGNGIQNMKQRAADSGFTIRIEPVAGGGTRVRLLV